MVKLLNYTFFANQLILQTQGPKSFCTSLWPFATFEKLLVTVKVQISFWKCNSTAD